MRIDRFKLIIQMVKNETNGKKLASEAGISYGTFCGIRSGRVCTEKTGQAIANALKVQLSDLLESNNES